MKSDNLYSCLSFLAGYGDRSAFNWALSVGAASPTNIIKTFGKVSAAFVHPSIKTSEVVKLTKFETHEILATGIHGAVIKLSDVGGNDTSLTCSIQFSAGEYSEEVAKDVIASMFDREFRIREEWDDEVVTTHGVVSLKNGSIEKMLDVYRGEFIGEVNIALSSSSERDFHLLAEQGWRMSYDSKLPFFKGRNFVLNPYFDIDPSISSDPDKLIHFLERHERSLEFIKIRVDQSDPRNGLPIDTVIFSKPDQSADIEIDYFPAGKAGKFRQILEGRL